MEAFQDDIPADSEHGRGVRPAHEIRMGRIKATLWPNRSESGVLWYSVEICRLYKDGATWKGSSRYSRDDLPLVTRVAEKALDWIYAQDSTRE